MQRIIAFLLLFVLLSVAAVTGFWCRTGRKRLPIGSDPKTEVLQRAVVKADASAAVGPKAEAQPALIGESQPRMSVTNGQEAIGKLHERLVCGDVAGALEGARQLMKSRDAEVREEAVRVFGQIGLKALPELADLIYDGDAAVSRAAFRHWKETVCGISDEGKKSRLLSAALLVVPDRTKIDELAAALSELPRPSAVRSLVNVIQNAPSVAAEAAAAQYQRLTAERYTTPQVAEAWIKAHGATDSAAQNKR